MTWIEVTDNAIKIGLGALIAGAITLLLSKSSSAHELRKEKIRRRSDMLERIAEDFEKSQTTFLHLYSTFSSYVILLSNPDAAAIQRDQIYEGIKKVSLALQILHEIE